MEEPVFTEDALKRLDNDARTTINKLDKLSRKAARSNDGDAWLKHQREAIHTIERHIQHFVDHGHYYAGVEEKFHQTVERKFAGKTSACSTRNPETARATSP